MASILSKLVVADKTTDKAVRAADSNSKNDEPSYVALSNFIISEEIARETDALLSSIKKENLRATDEYKKKIQDRNALNVEKVRVDNPIARMNEVNAGRWVEYNKGGRPIYDKDLQAQLKKKFDEMRAKETKGTKHNESVTAKQEAIELEANAIATRIRQTDHFYEVLERARRRPLMFDAASLTARYPREQQSLILKMITKGARVSFANGDYETGDIRVLAALLDFNEPVSLLE